MRIYTVTIDESTRYYTTIEKARAAVAAKGARQARVINEAKNTTELWVVPANEMFDAQQIHIGWLDAE